MTDWPRWTSPPRLPWWHPLPAPWPKGHPSTGLLTPPFVQGKAPTCLRLLTSNGSGRGGIHYHGATNVHHGEDNFHQGETNFHSGRKIASTVKLIYTMLKQTFNTMKLIFTTLKHFPSWWYTATAGAQKFVLNQKQAHKMPVCRNNFTGQIFGKRFQHEELCKEYKF